MNYLELAKDELIAKVKAARADVPDVAALGKTRSVPAGASFMVEKQLFVWLPDDRTPADGDGCIRLEGTPESAPGRFRRAGLGRPGRRPGI